MVKLHHSIEEENDGFHGFKCSASFFLFYQHSIPAHGMVPVTVKVSFPISVITTKHLGTPRSFSLLCLDPVKFAINIIHHWQRQAVCLQAL